MVLCDRGNNCVLIFDWEGRLQTTLNGNPVSKSDAKYSCTYNIRLQLCRDSFYCAGLRSEFKLCSVEVGGVECLCMITSTNLI